MLRIIKDGKPVSLKEQEKLVSAKGSIESVGPKFDPAKRKIGRKRLDKHTGLRPIQEKKENGTQAKRAESKGK